MTDTTILRRLLREACDLLDEVHSDETENFIARCKPALLDAQTEQPDLQLSAREVEGDAPDQTEVSSGPSAAPTDNTALVEALDVCLEWIDAVPSDTPLPAMPGFDRDWVDNIRNRAALASREAKPAPDAVAEAAIADDDSLAKRISELGWQIHNLGCEYQNDEKLLDRLQDLRGMAWEIADTVREGAA